MKQIRVEVAPGKWLGFHHDEETDELTWCWETGQPANVTAAMRARIEEALGAIYDALGLEQLIKEITDAPTVH